MAPLSETFLIMLTTTASATVLVCLRWAYKSKCSNVKCCCMEIQRDVSGEERLDVQQPPSPSNSNKIERTISL